MTLDEVRVEIDRIDSQIKPLFLQRMECSKHVAEAKAVTGGDVFVLERELAIIEKRTADVDESVRSEYVAFLRHLMSVSRRYQYGMLTEMQETVLASALEAAGLDGTVDHSQVEIAFTCSKEASDLNLFINIVRLNEINIDSMKLESQDGTQTVTMVLDGNMNEKFMRCMLCQIGKEAENFQILSLR